MLRIVTKPLSALNQIKKDVAVVERVSITGLRLPQPSVTLIQFSGTWGRVCFLCRLIASVIDDHVIVHSKVWERC
jgi:hypothetical protein